MIFFADEGLDAPLVDLLRKEGYSLFMLQKKWQVL